MTALPSKAEILALGREAEAMIEALAAISASPNALTRLYLSREHRRAADLVAGWMRNFGLSVSEDAAGTVRGRLTATGKHPSNRRLLVGSHIDTVIDAGKYDGNLGVICGLLAAREIKRRGIEIPFGLDILAFGDEEGVRFPTTLLSSSAVAGHVSPNVLEGRDEQGISVAEALRSFGGDPAGIRQCADDPGEVIGYLEVHIEQGPVLEARDTPLGIVTSIAGAERYRIAIQGMAGHAGTVPMNLRHDALVAAAELIQFIETTALRGESDSLVATVGELSLKPGAVNVIPASVDMTLDIRAAKDSPRQVAVAAIRDEALRISAARGCRIDLVQYHETATCACSLNLQDLAAAALETLGIEPLRMMSGAGHDGQAMSKLTDIGMLFVRCRGGISHNPLESVTLEDMGFAVEAMVRWIEQLAYKERTN